MAFKKLLGELVVVLVFSFAIALAFNGLSPKGIPLKGMWDVSRGVVSAFPERTLSGGGVEIEDVLIAKKIYQQQAALFVDARPYDLYEEGHIPGAVSFPRGEMENKIAEFMDGYAEGQLIVIYCSGRECEDSHFVAEFLKGLGLSNIRIFIDGFPGWVQEGLSVE